MSNSEDSWIKRNSLKLYSFFIILILIIACTRSVFDFVSYTTGEKTEATVTEVINKRIFNYRSSIVFLLESFCYNPLRATTTVYSSLSLVAPVSTNPFFFQKCSA